MNTNDTPTRDPDDSAFSLRREVEAACQNEAGNSSDTTDPQRAKPIRDAVNDAKIGVSRPDAWDAMLNEYDKLREFNGGMGRVFELRSRTTGKSFAAKTAAIANHAPHARLQFMAELRCVMELPLHEHLVAYRFVRVVAGDVIIFSDFVEGGTLESWMVSGRLYRNENPVERILDISIQMLFGLRQLHDWNLIHRDIKPSNVLMTEDGLAKIGDFGLVSVAGRTPPYQSPEQSRGGRVSWQTDLWSWAITVFALFVGHNPCENGLDAPEELNAYLSQQKNEKRSAVPEMPAAVARILHDCFDGIKRFQVQSVAEVLDRLNGCLESHTGHIYARRAGTIPRTVDGVFHYPLGIDGQDSRRFLAWLLALHGYSEKEAWGLVCAVAPETIMCHRAYEAARVALYSSILIVFDPSVIPAAADELEESLAINSFMAGDALLAANDPYGGISRMRDSLDSFERLLRVKNTPCIQYLTAMAHFELGQMLGSLDDHMPAIEHINRSLSLLDGLLADHPTFIADYPTLTDRLTQIHSIRGECLIGFGKADEAIAAFDAAISLLQANGTPPASPEAEGTCPPQLTKLHLGKAHAFNSLGMHDEARSLCDEAIKNAAPETPLWEVAPLYNEKAIACSAIGEYAVGLHSVDECLRMTRNLNNLQKARATRASLLCAAGRREEALSEWSRMIQINRRLIDEHGQVPFAAYLFGAYLQKSQLLLSMGACAAAAEDAAEFVRLLVGILRKPNYRRIPFSLTIALRHADRAFRASGSDSESAQMYADCLAKVAELNRAEFLSQIVADLLEHGAWLIKERPHSAAIVLSHGCRLSERTAINSAEERHSIVVGHTMAALAFQQIGELSLAAEFAHRGVQLSATLAAFTKDLRVAQMVVLAYLQRASVAEKAGDASNELGALSGARDFFRDFVSRMDGEYSDRLSALDLICAQRFEALGDKRGALAARLGCPRSPSIEPARENEAGNS